MKIQEIIKNSPYTKELGILALNNGVVLPFLEKNTNSYGGLHGGVFPGYCDLVAIDKSATLYPELRFMTKTLSVDYLEPAKGALIAATKISVNKLSRKGNRMVEVEIVMFSVDKRFTISELDELLNLCLTEKLNLENQLFRGIIQKVATATVLLIETKIA